MNSGGHQHLVSCLETLQKALKGWYVLCLHLGNASQWYTVNCSALEQPARLLLAQLAVLVVLTVTEPACLLCVVTSEVCLCCFHSYCPCLNSTCRWKPAVSHFFWECLFFSMWNDSACFLSVEWAWVRSGGCFWCWYITAGELFSLSKAHFCFLCPVSSLPAMTDRLESIARQNG